MVATTKYYGVSLSGGIFGGEGRRHLVDNWFRASLVLWFGECLLSGSKKVLQLACAMYLEWVHTNLVTL